MGHRGSAISPETAFLKKNEKRQDVCLAGVVRELVEEVRVVLGLLPLLEGNAERVADENSGQREEVDVVVIHAEDLASVVRSGW